MRAVFLFLSLLLTGALCAPTWNSGFMGPGSSEDLGPCPGGQISVIVITVTATAGSSPFPSNVSGGPPTIPSLPQPSYPSIPAEAPTGPSSLLVNPGPTNRSSLVRSMSSPSSPSVAELPPETRQPSGSVPTTVTTANAPTSSTSNIESPTQSSGSSPDSGGIPMIDTINKWRRIQGHPEMTWDPTLQNNAQSTVDDNGGGVKMDHSGPNAQVLVSGFDVWPTGEVHYARGTQFDNGTTWADVQAEFDNMTPFEWAYIQWLCEYPVVVGPGNYNGMDYCSMNAIILNNAPWSPTSPHGHYDILTGNYAKAGCAYKENVNTKEADNFWPQWAGQWGCNFA